MMKKNSRKVKFLRTASKMIHENKSLWRYLLLMLHELILFLAQFWSFEANSALRIPVEKKTSVYIWYRKMSMFAVCIMHYNYMHTIFLYLIFLYPIFLYLFLVTDFFSRFSKGLIFFPDPSKRDPTICDNFLFGSIAAQGDGEGLNPPHHHSRLGHSRASSRDGEDEHPTSSCGLLSEGAMMGMTKITSPSLWTALVDMNFLFELFLSKGCQVVWKFLGDNNINALNHTDNTYFDWQTIPKLWNDCQVFGIWISKIWFGKKITN